MKVLMTGASGRVGTAVRPFLRDKFELRLFDRVPPVLPPVGTEEVVVGDLVSVADVRAALVGVDAVLHLACVHGFELTFEGSLDVNYRAMMILLQESLAAGVSRFVYASSHHVLGSYRRDDPLPTGVRMAPDAFYGLGKAFGELACSMYAQRFGLPVFVVRIGNADPAAGDGRTVRLWTSARDLASLFGIGLTMPGLEHEVVYGVSRCPDGFFDNSRAFELGYDPLDDADTNRAEGFVGRSAMPPELGPEWVGGGYVAAPLPQIVGEE